MTTVPLATGARLLGIHPKTLRHWLITAHLPVVVHPTDARIRCVAQDHLLELARRHSRPLPDLSSARAWDRDTASACLADEQAQPLPAYKTEPASLADLLGQLAQLHSHLATLQHQLTALALAVLPERTERSDYHLSPLQERLSQPLESVQPSQPTELPGARAPSPAPAYRLLPVEMRARSRVTALIEYGAQGQDVAVCPHPGPGPRFAAVV